MRTLCKGLADSAAVGRRAAEGKRVANTKPTLPLERYAGTYADSLFGTATIGLQDGHLTFQAGNLKGQLEHWQYDIFRVSWADPFWETEYLAFAIDPDGAVGEVRVVEGEPVYRRVK